MGEESLVLRLTVFSSIDSAESVEEVMRLVFYNRQGNFDINSSVYIIPPSAVTQILAEHTINVVIEPDTKGAVNIKDPRPVPVPDDPDDPEVERGVFEYRANTHHQIKFQNEQQALLLAQDIFNNLEDRAIVTDVDEIDAYIQDRIDEKDEEWFTACRDSKRVRKWVAKTCDITTDQLKVLIGI